MRPARVLGLVAALALTSCTSDDDGGTSADPTPSASPTPTVAPEPPPRPALGACYRISYEEALAPTNADTPMACDKAHTSQTFAVGRLDLVAGGHLLAVDSESVTRVTCPLTATSVRCCSRTSRPRR